jgi:transcriptional regulator with XRE-family HTH domain
LSDFPTIDAKRKAAGFTVAALCRKAQVPISTYWRVAKGRKKRWRDATVEKFQAALVGQSCPGRAPEPTAPPDHLASIYRAYVAILSPELGADPETVLASDPSLRATSSPQWREAARVRAIAVYCVSIELAVPAARVAAAIGVTRAAASAMLRRVEDFRDDPEIDALVERVGKLVSGRT